MFNGLLDGWNRQAQDELTTHIGVLQGLLRDQAEGMGKARPEDAAKIRAKMEELSFMVEQTNKALEKLYKADEDSHLASM